MANSSSSDIVKILVTGGAGFIASSVVKRLAADPKNYVVIVDNLLTGDLKKLPKSVYNNIEFIKADVNNFNDITDVFLLHHFKYVFHYAAVVGVQRTLDHPLLVLQDLQGMRNILNLAATSESKRVFFSSSSEVYGEPVEYPQNEETTPLNSRLPYAIVKNAGEAYLKAYHKEYGLSYTIFRFFNTYGSKQSPDFVISRFIQAALKNEPITINGDGKQTRTFCFIDDNADACMEAFLNEKSVDDVINIGSEIETSILELAQLIIRLTKSSSKIVFLPALTEGDMTRRKPDTTKMKQLLHRELIPLEEGIKKLLTDTTFIL
ncbi:MAG: NAD-dependent epimerase/dehydratase family protein [Bacteroidetes bacterium]|jgi:UDP-glucose 4-epimerase|nr:NAD-dependent epimerase/dehydratase family protein [Bacteroidota bacterium]